MWVRVRTHGLRRGAVRARGVRVRRAGGELPLGFILFIYFLIFLQQN